jgi:hypothetical protein
MNEWDENRSPPALLSVGIRARQFKPNPRDPITKLRQRRPRRYFMTGARRETIQTTIRKPLKDRK